MTDSPAPPLEGVRVVEVSMWAFVPSAAAVLADWGADVIKVVPTHIEDPMIGRGVIADLPPPRAPIAYMWQLLNRGKRCVALDLRSEAGRAVLRRLVGSADVFVTNLLPDAQQRFEVTQDQVTALKPEIVYAVGTSHGTEGPEARRGGFDATSFWARSGLGYTASQTAEEYLGLISPAVGDILSGLALAGGIAAALVRRDRTGTGVVVDASLLATGMYAISPAITASELHGVDTIPRYRHAESLNPLSATYATKDGRSIVLGAVLSGADWPEVCSGLGAHHLAEDPRFSTSSCRAEHRADLLAELDSLFRGRTLAEWRAILNTGSTPWGFGQTPREVHDDPQVIANRYIVAVETPGGSLPIVPSPVHFDGAPADVRAAPEPGSDTELVLAELGYSTDQVTELRRAGIVR